MVTWSPWDPDRGRDQQRFSLQKISAGRFDNYVRRWTRGMAAYGEPVYLRFAHEMNGSWYPWSTAEGSVAGNAPEGYVAAWRRIHDTFEEEGADNVEWVWSPTADVHVEAAALRLIYPGDEYVDWAALDGYNWGTATAFPWSGWRSFEEVFVKAHDELAAVTGRPVMIAETASAEDGGDKADWIRQAYLRTLPEKLPQVRAVIWFSSDKRDRLARRVLPRIPRSLPRSSRLLPLHRRVPLAPNTAIRAPSP